MATFVPIHAAGDGAWNWHLVEAELRSHGHDVVAVDLPTDESADLWTYADVVVDAVGDRQGVIVVAHSFGGFTAPLVCSRLATDALVMLSAMIPSPGEPPAEWWANTRQGEAQRLAGTAGQDDMATYYHDVPDELAHEALRRARDHPSTRAYEQPWPLDAWPDVSTEVLICRNDRLLPADWMRRLARDRLGVEATAEIDTGHCPMLARPAELARRLGAYVPGSA
jgi:pimeloyl-ACP methyl ester carboxylesterase